MWVWYRIGTQSHTRSVDALIAGIARRQHGVVARWQLLAKGISARQITIRLKDERLAQIHRGVYVVGAVPGPHAHEAAALLAYGRGTVLSHRSAAHLWNLLSYKPTVPVWVTIPPERSARRPRIKAVRNRLNAADIRRREDMPLTSPPRTILDMAALLDPYDLESLVAEAEFRRVARLDEMRDQLTRNRGARGTGVLRDVLDLPGGPRRTRSPAERQLLRLLREAGVEGFDTNARIEGYEVHFLWADERFVVEVDGWDGHSGRVAFERDRLKTATLGGAGIQVMPVTGRQLRRAPADVIDRITRAVTEARRRVS